MIEAKVILDSVNKYGDRLTTIEATYPRFVHSELLTHRAFARNSASSRAIPARKMRSMVIERPAMPVEWGAAQAGMQAYELVSPARQWLAEMCWIAFSRIACVESWILDKIGIHKQLSNRWLEPCSHITTLISATDWDGFFAQRCHHAAQPEMQRLAIAIRTAMRASTPVRRTIHTPYLTIGESRVAHVDQQMMRISAARCARVSYLTHDGRRDQQADLRLFDRLVARAAESDEPRHLSPLEHIATAGTGDTRSGPYRGWVQYRESYAS